MKLSEEDRKKIVDWIRKKTGQPRCNMCGTGQWTVVDAATLPIGFDVHTTRFFYHQGIPQVTIVCNNCGHMVFFNAAVLGFEPDEPEKEIVPDKPDPKKKKTD